jgi:hypothetical protein
MKDVELDRLVALSAVLLCILHGPRFKTPSSLPLRSPVKMNCAYPFC